VHYAYTERNGYRATAAPKAMKVLLVLALALAGCSRQATAPVAEVHTSPPTEGTWHVESYRMGVVTMHHEGRIYVASCIGVTSARLGDKKEKHSVGNCLLPTELVGLCVEGAAIGHAPCSGEKEAEGVTTNVLYPGGDLLEIERSERERGYIQDLFRITEIREAEHSE
jgi:hypothetical protein